MESFSEFKTVCITEEYPYACAHYYSAIHADPKKKGRSKFTCGDDQSRVNQDYTKDWTKDHNEVWGRFTDVDWTFRGKGQKDVKKEPLKCEADEWPPAYFVPEDGVQKPEWGQRIRWLPKEDNGGAASLWTPSCAKHDGGYLNHQRIRPPRRDKDTKVVEPLEEYE